MKKTIAIITALVLGCTILTACNNQNIISKIDENNSGLENQNKPYTSAYVSESQNKSDTSVDVPESQGESYTPVDDIIYEPKQNEQRFLSILKEIQEKQTMSIKNFDTALERTVTSFATDGRSILEYDIYAYTNDVSSFATYTLETFGKNNTYTSYNFDPDAKIYSKSSGTLSATDKEEYEKYSDKSLNFKFYSPDKWTFISSDTVEIYGHKYYCENYKSDSIIIDGYTFKEKADVSIAFDSNGEVAFMKTTTISDTSNNDTSSQPSNYVYFNITADIDPTLFNVDGYKEVPFYNEYYNHMAQSISDRIDEVLDLN